MNFEIRERHIGGIRMAFTINEYSDNKENDSDG